MKSLSTRLALLSALALSAPGLALASNEHGDGTYIPRTSMQEPVKKQTTENRDNRGYSLSSQSGASAGDGMVIPSWERSKPMNTAEKR